VLTLRAISFIILAALIVVLIVPDISRRRRSGPRLERPSEDWDRIRTWVDKLLFQSGRPVAPVCVLMTHYGLAIEAQARALHDWIATETDDYVQMKADPEHVGHEWLVVTTTESLTVTPAAAADWVQRMQGVCGRFPSRIAGLEVIWGGSPPVSASVGAARG